MTAQLISTELQIGDSVKKAEAYGGGKTVEIIDIGECNKWPINPPYYHTCNKPAIRVFDGERLITAHADMYQSAP